MAIVNTESFKKVKHNNQSKILIGQFLGQALVHQFMYYV